jgi:hypothetical protein
VGLSGGVHVGRGFCPSNDSVGLHQECMLGLNDSHTCSVGSTCSDTVDVGDFVVMVEALLDSSRPVTYIDEATSTYQSFCEPGSPATCSYVRHMVGPEDTLLTTTQIPGGSGSLPRFNDPARFMAADALPLTWFTTAATSTRNELRQDRGAYLLQVTHESYTEGALASTEVRPGCVNFGQWRRFTLLTKGETAATLTAVLTTPDGAGVVRRSPSHDHS